MTQTMLKKCECPDSVQGGLLGDDWYLPEEYKARSHETNQCPGDYDLRRFRRGGTVRILCSCCHLPGDVLLGDTEL